MSTQIIDSSYRLYRALVTAGLQKCLKRLVYTQITVAPRQIEFPCFHHISCQLGRKYASDIIRAWYSPAICNTPTVGRESPFSELHVHDGMAVALISIATFQAETRLTSGVAVGYAREERDCLRDPESGRTDRS